jgi:hypothetical protein
VLKYGSVLKWCSPNTPRSNNPVSGRPSIMLVRITIFFRRLVGVGSIGGIQVGLHTRAKPLSTSAGSMEVNGQSVVLVAEIHMPKPFGDGNEQQVADEQDIRGQDCFFQIAPLVTQVHKYENDVCSFD